MYRFATKLMACAVVVLALSGAPSAHGQGGYVNQQEIAQVLEGQQMALDDIPEVFYDYYVFFSSRNSTVLARNNLYKIIGDGDMAAGQRRAKLVEFLNRTDLQFTQIGDTLVVPQKYDLDFRAYSPFPRYYPGGKEFDKLFIIDKTVQAFAAYENGALARWGVVNTGAEESRTPNGRYNFNWKTEYRISAESPPGDPWEMYWVFNFHDARGIHVHQYAMPTGGPRSKGCVRLIDADAQWIYNWADGWALTRNGPGFPARGQRIREPGTTVLVIGEDPVDQPEAFSYKPRFPVLRKVKLPDHPFDIPPGTPQQKYFDRHRTSAP